MGLELCKNCGRMHYQTDSCQPATKSTAARKDVQTDGRSRRSGPKGQAAKVGDDVAQSGRAAGAARRVGGSNPSITAGTQALSVDTSIPTPKRGRPKTITDMKAYKAEHERNRRARIKAAKIAP